MTRGLVGVLLAALVAVAGGCGDGADPGPGANPNRIAFDAANGATPITIGSKNFAEQYILGEIYAQALKAAGFKVRKQLDLGSEQIAYRVLQSNAISAYPEYSGTALTAFYGYDAADVSRDPAKSFGQLERAARADGVTALPQTRFENTYVITSTVDTYERLGEPKTISEVVERAGADASISGFAECRQRPDCLKGLNKLYGWDPKFVVSQGKYEDLDKGVADFTFGFGTDGELALGKYVSYADDRGLYPPYFVSLLVNEEGIAALGEAGREVIAKVQTPLTEARMAELNSKVTIDEEKPADVAAEYLRAEGFVG